MTINTEYKSQTADYLALKPLVAAMNANNDRLPNNSLPVDTSGTIQQNAEKQAKPAPAIYNAHGILRTGEPNTLLGYA